MEEAAWIISTAAFSFFVALASLPPPTVVALGIIALIAVAVLMQARWLTFILLVAFTLRFSLAFFQEHYGILPYVWDEEFYHEIGVAAAQMLAEGNYSLPERVAIRGTVDFGEAQVAIGGFGNKWYGIVSGSFYYLLGSAPMTMRVVNSAFGTLAIFFVYKITCLVYRTRSGALRAALVSGVLPSAVVFSSLHMRDSLIWLLLVVFLYHLLCWMKAQRLRDLATTIVAAVFICQLRPAYLLVLLTVALPFVGQLISSRIWKDFVGRPVVLVAAPICFVVLWQWLSGWDTKATEYLSVERVEYERAWRALRGSVYLTNHTYQEWTDVFRVLPIRILHFTFGPFFWNAKSPVQVVAALESICILLLAVRAAINCWRFGGSSGILKLELLLFWYALIGLSAGAIVDSNYGTAIRHRMAYTFIFAIIAFGSQASNVGRQIQANRKAKSRS